MRKAGLVVLFIVLVVQPLLPQEKRTALSFFGGAAAVFSHGSKSDYAAGENDFPVTPGYTAYSFGMAVSHQFSRKFGLELEVRDIAAQRITLTDPSDDDTVRLKTREHLALTLHGLYFLSGGTLQPYLRLGAGADFVLDAEQKSVTSDLGYRVIFPAPRNTVDFTAGAGLGLLVLVNPRLAGRFDLRYVVVPKTSDHPARQSLWVSGGLLIRLF